MNLRELLRAVSAHAPFSALSAVADASSDAAVTGIVYDSRQATSGWR